MDTPIYRDGSTVAASIPYVDESGVAVTPATVSYRVYDQAGAEVVAPTDLPYAGETAAAVTVDGALNTLGASDRVLRVIEVTMTTVTGTKIQALFRYIIERAVVLAVAQNSYQSYEQALINALDIPGLAAWNKSSERERLAGLIEAHHRLGKLRYSIAYPDDQSRLTTAEEIYDLNGLTAEELALLDARFLTALYKAQVVEADVVLGGTPIDEQRESGLMSSSVGEVSQMYRPGKPVILPVSRRTLRYLTGYVRFGMGLGRGS